MCRNWKNVAAVGLAVLIGCMMPMSTMLAADTEADAVVENGGESVSDGGNVLEDVDASGGENDPEDGSVPDEENTPEDENVSDKESTPEEELVSDEENTPEDGSVSEGENADIISDAGVLSVPMAASAAEDVESESAPVITITRGGADMTCDLGGTISFEYANNFGTMFEVSVDQSDENVSLYYYVDKVTDMEAEAKKKEVMDSLYWAAAQSLHVSVDPLNDGCYVLYVKVEAGEQKYYARSEGVVVDTKKPVITGVEEGKTYQEGTLFQVEDANLDYVLVNEQQATPENSNYKVAANGTSCMIRAKDKAGNETTCSITVLGSETPEPEKPKPETPEPEKPDDSNVISKSGEYTLRAGVKYHLAAGKWKVDGDKSVYQGGNDFYVKADGSYKFIK